MDIILYMRPAALLEVEYPYVIIILDSDIVILPLASRATLVTEVSVYGLNVT